MADQSDSTPNNNRLENIDRTTLTPLVQRALNSETCEVIDWNYRPLYGGAGDAGKGLSGIYRFSGKGRDQGQTVPWSLVLKIIGSSEQGGDPQGGTREHLAYQSGVLNDLSGSFVAARCFDVVEREQGVYWLWLEEVIDEMDSQWSLAQYGLAANHLGQFNGIYLTRGSLPDWPWLSKDWLRTFIAPNTTAMPQLTDGLDHPLFRRWYPADVVERLARLWQESEIFLTTLDSLPQTLCHRDAWSRNLFVRHDREGRMQTVAIDWTFTGLGAVGEEIAALIQTKNLLEAAEIFAAEMLDTLVFNNYLDGLREVGWDGDPQTVRLGYTASSALRYGLGFTAQILDIIRNIDQNNMDWLLQVFNVRSIEEVADCWAALFQYLLKLADEARTLIDVVS